MHGETMKFGSMWFTRNPVLLL